MPTFSASTLSCSARSHQSRECIVRQLGVPVVRDRARHLAITALDKNVGECLVDAEARRHCQQMRLALVLGDVHEVAIGKPRLLEHRTGDRDVIVLGERADDAGRRVGDRRDAAREFGQRLRLDLLDQAADNVVEQRDVLRA